MSLTLTDSYSILAKHIVSGPLADMLICLAERSLSIQSERSKIIAVYKSDDETEPDNYRPISVLSISIGYLKN